MLRELIAVGDVMLDGALPAPVPGRRIHGRIELRAGGSAANAALAAVRLGASAAVVGRIGADAAGRLVADELAAAGVEVLLARDEDAPTGSVVVLGGSAIVADPGASALARARGRAGPARGRRGPRLRLLAPTIGLRGGRAGGRSSARRPAGSPSTQPRRTCHGVRGGAVLRCDRGGRRAARERRGGVRADRARGRGRGARARPALPCRLRQARRRGAVAASAGATARAVVRPVEGGASALGAGDSFAAGFLLALAGGAGLAAALQAGCDTATASIVERATSRA